MMKLDQLARTTLASVALVLAPLVASAATVNISVIASSGDGSGSLANTAHLYAGSYGAFVPVGATFDAAVITPPSGSVAGEYRSPWDATGVVDSPARTFYAIGPNVGTNPNPATLDFGSNAQSALTFLWGSVDTYNYVTFGGLGSGDSDVTISGSSVASLLGGVCGTGTNAGCTALVSLSLSGADTFKTVSFESRGSQAFEMALAPVPVPAAGLLLIGGLGALAAFKRRKSA